MAYFRTCHSQDLYMILQDLDNHTGERDCRFTKSRWDLFFIYFYGIGGTRLRKYWPTSYEKHLLLPLLLMTRESLFFLPLQEIYSSRVVEGSVRCSGTRSSPRLHSMTGNQTRRQQQVHYLTFNLSFFTLANQGLRDRLSSAGIDDGQQC